MKILIVEHHTPTAKALHQMIDERLKDHTSYAFAKNLSEGIIMSVEFDADITILDPHLPDAGYRQAAESIPQFPPPVIVVSDFPDDETKAYQRFCYANGAAGYMSMDELRSTILNRAGANLVSALIKAAWRSYLPTEKVKTVHAQALAKKAARSVSLVQNHVSV